MVRTEDRKTPLYHAHESLKARMTHFYGWLLPIQYTSIIEEHNAARTKAALFDISHLGKVEVTGSGSLEFLQSIFTRDISGAAFGKIVYSPMCNYEGGILDDVFIYRFSDDRYILIANAGTFEKDFNWFKSNKIKTADIKDINDFFGGIAIQGPASVEIVKGMCEADLNKLAHRGFCETKISGFNCLLSRSGYTGEDGFEIFLRSENSEDLWFHLLEAGRSRGLIPAGLGARDTLRLEAGCPLYGVDIDEKRTPFEAGLEKALSFKKDFIGKNALLKRRADGIKEKLVGFKMIDKAVARGGCLIEKYGEKTGAVTSGSYSPTLKENIGFGYVGIEYSKINTELEIVVHGERKRALVTEVPFYRRPRND
ncbi:MAG: glycine cleavage system aminomethyltransferase GcvT [Candidatus Omnitrophota bacterium]